MLRNYASFIDHQHRASELGYELYLIEHSTPCAFGKRDKQNDTFTPCESPAIVTMIWLTPPNTYRGRHVCEKHLKYCLGLK